MAWNSSDEIQKCSNTRNKTIAIFHSNEDGLWLGKYFLAEFTYIRNSKRASGEASEHVISN